MEQPTEQQLQRHISAAFDSVSLINRIISEEDTPNKPSRMIDANVGHLNIMLGKEWFADGLTEQQRTDIDAAIAAGNTYLETHPLEPNNEIDF
jgi:hypothetical protein